MTETSIRQDLPVDLAEGWTGTAILLDPKADKAPTGRIGQARRVDRVQVQTVGEGAVIKEGAVENIAGVEVAAVVAAVSTEAAKVGW